MTGFPTFYEFIKFDYGSFIKDRIPRSFLSWKNILPISNPRLNDMDTHYHLFIETPSVKLTKIMQHINGAYTTYFNRKRGQT